MAEKHERVAIVFERVTGRLIMSKDEALALAGKIKITVKGMEKEKKINEEKEG